MGMSKKPKRNKKDIDLMWEKWCRKHSGPRPNGNYIEYSYSRINGVIVAHWKIRGWFGKFCDSFAGYWETGNTTPKQLEWDLNL